MPTREVLKPVDDAGSLIPRSETKRLFRVSVDTLRRMERAGLLKPIRLSGRPQSWVHYRRAEVEALLEHGVSVAPAAVTRAKLKPLADREADLRQADAGQATAIVHRNDEAPAKLMTNASQLWLGEQPIDHVSSQVPRPATFEKDPRYVECA